MTRILELMSCVLVCGVLLTAGCSKRDDTSKAGKSGGEAASPPAKQSSPSAPTAPVPTAPAPVATAPVPTAPAPEAAPVVQVAPGLDQSVKSVDFQTLKAMLPETLAGLKRTDLSGEKMEAMGIDMSHAEAQYEAPEGQAGRIRITLTDVGSASGPMKMGLTAWAMRKYERQTDNGYEKTVTYNGCPAMEEVDRSSQQATLRVFVADRFVAELAGSDTTIETVRKAADGLDLKKLASLAGK